MKVDNRLNTAKLKIGYLITLIFVVAISMYYYFEKLDNIIYPIVAGSISFIYILPLLRKMNYFFIEYIGNKITVRYYTAYPIFRKYKAFEIQKAYFHDYIIKSTLLGFHKSVQFTVKTPKGKFNYPSLSITLLTKKQTDDLIKMLDELKS